MDRLEQMLAPKLLHLVMLRAGMGKKQRQLVAERLAAIPRDEPRVLLATGKYVGEGFDDARLDTLFLTLPVSWRGTVAQYAGRHVSRHNVIADEVRETYFEIQGILHAEPVVGLAALSSRHTSTDVSL